MHNFVQNQLIQLVSSFCELQTKLELMLEVVLALVRPKLSKVRIDARSDSSIGSPKLSKVRINARSSSSIGSPQVKQS